MSFSGVLKGVTSKIVFGGKPPDPQFTPIPLHAFMAIALQQLRLP